MSLFIIMLLSFSIHCRSETNNEREQKNTDVNLDQEEIYKALYKHKRADQLEAVRSILNLNDYAKQYKMVQLVFDQVTQIMSKARVRLEHTGFLPGDKFPEDIETRDALANVLENTALLGEIVLRLPDISHKILKRNNENNLLLSWSISFCQETDFLDNSTKVLLHLAAQELTLIPQDPSFINPYKMVKDSQEKKITEQLPKTTIKQKKAKTRGPRLSNQKHQEL